LINGRLLLNDKHFPPGVMLWPSLPCLTKRMGCLVIPPMSHPVTRKLDRFFQLTEHGTTVTREVIAGLTTFAAMAYILAVNPGILEAAGIDRGAALTATALAAALGSLLMGLLANLPIAQAPGMGLNAFFAFTICLSLGVPWQAALGLVFYSGVLFFLLTITGLRRQIVEAMPPALKIGISCGIGLFIALLGLQKCGLVVADPVTLVRLGSLHTPTAALALGGIILAAILVARKVPAALLLAIGILTVVGLFLPGSTEGSTLTPHPTSVVSWPASLAPTFLALDLAYLWTHFGTAFGLVLALLFVDLFDSMGTLLGVCQRGGLIDKQGRIPKLPQALMADASASMTGALLGSSTTTSYIESAAGIEEGGRTGLTAMVVAGCFLLSLLFTPLLLIIPSAATAPALVVVGLFMLQAVGELPLRDWRECAPGLLVLIMIPLSFSISDGIALGFLAYLGLQLGTGRMRQVSWTQLFLGFIFLLHFVLVAV
jgi:AGZA family xanthine/uracil permease-like MFS transporter